ncbi:amidohydrolase family protein [Paraburkholderia sp. EG287B]|uniref:amidohydrolase family protein n=1 Tax=unclassified Paraburkholderia TaxID=2615204 RepID=UPI0034D32137
MTYSPASVEFLISVVGADQVMFGTDWPHQVHDTRGVGAALAWMNFAPIPRRDPARRLRSESGLRGRRDS